MTTMKIDRAFKKKVKMMKHETYKQRIRKREACSHVAARLDNLLIIFKFLDGVVVGHDDDYCSSSLLVFT